MELHQAHQYQTYMRLLKWDVDAIESEFVYSKHIPLVGKIAKLQRWQRLPDIQKLTALLQSIKVKTVAFEPAESINSKDTSAYAASIKAAGFRLNTSPFLATKTIRISLTNSESDIFNAFSEAKRRAVRRAEKNNITTKESTDIQTLIRTKNTSAGLFGFITTYGIKELWKAFTTQATCVLAYTSEGKPLGGILLIFCDKIAYYWIAGATTQGKKLFAPTLLVWEALKISKKTGNHTFDFVGVWDERRPNQNRDWLGFTKFKEGFGGVPVYYPLATPTYSS